jgi:DNA-binding MarR family transcriptional regulator
MPPNEITSDSLAIEVLDSVPLVMYCIRRSLRKYEKLASSVPQIRVLAFLRRAPGTSLTQLSDSIGVTKATASNLIDRMVQRGFVTHVENVQERRSVKLSATNLGEQHLDSARSIILKELSEVLAKLTDDERRKVFEGASLLRAHFQA